MTATLCAAAMLHTSVWPIEPRPVEPLPPRPGATHLATDSEIERAVVKAIVADPGVLAAQLRVSVKDGVVTLDGTVRSEAARKAAEELAALVPGVRSVRNRLDVRQPAR